MAESKIYLNVPYAQKDEAKALGARWDAANKKWYAPANKDITLFAKWQTESTAPELPSTTTSISKPRASTGKTASSANHAEGSVFTHPTVKDFVAYNGDEPPWD